MSDEPLNPRLTTALALTPVIFLTLLLATSVYLFGADSSYGANQIALILASCVAALVAKRIGLPGTWPRKALSRASPRAWDRP